MLTRITANALWWAGLSGIWYLAMEPFARRICPEMLVSITRMMHGRFRDPLVGRDMLIGQVLGVIWFVLNEAVMALGEWAGSPPPRLWLIDLNAVTDTRELLNALGILIVNGVFVGLWWLFLWVMLRTLIKHAAAARVSFFVIGLGIHMGFMHGGGFLVTLAFGIVGMIMILLIMNRIGALALTVSFSVTLLFTAVPPAFSQNNASFEPVLILMTLLIANTLLSAVVAARGQHFCLQALWQGRDFLIPHPMSNLGVGNSSWDSRSPSANDYDYDNNPPVAPGPATPLPDTRAPNDSNPPDRFYEA